MKTTTPSSHAAETGIATGRAADLNNLGSVPIFETDNLDETVLGHAAADDLSGKAPELAAGTETLTVWDEPAHASGRWTPREGMDDEATIAGRLVEAGLAEADRERRVAAHGAEE